MPIQWKPMDKNSSNILQSILFVSYRRNKAILVSIPPCTDSTQAVCGAVHKQKLTWEAISVPLSSYVYESRRCSLERGLEIFLQSKNNMSMLDYLDALFGQRYESLEVLWGEDCPEISPDLYPETSWLKPQIHIFCSWPCCKYRKGIMFIERWLHTLYICISGSQLVGRDLSVLLTCYCKHHSIGNLAVFFIF